ncbi:MAG: hypothetical protein K6G80_09415 [Treponema sp.]|nr:hypothetical protein [Treponema sp.]
MKKTALLFCGAFSLAAAAWSMDFGALAANSSVLEGNKASEMKLDQNDSISAWIRIPFGKSAYFTTEGLYRYKTKYIDVFNVEEEAKDPDDESLFDLSLAKLSVNHVTQGGGTVLLAAGRFGTADATGIIYSQTADGVSAGYASPYINLSAYGAYTGLLNTRTVSMLDESGYAPEDPEKKYELADKYVIGLGTVSVPNVFRNQTVTAQVVGAFRTEKERFNRMYATIAFNGPILPRLYYTVSSSLGLRQFDGENDLTNLSKGSLALYTGIHALTFTVNALYASGEQGPFKAFESITSQTAVKSYGERTEYTGLFLAGLSTSVKPVRQLLLSLGADAIFDAQESTCKYEGFQWQTGANWQIASDVSLCLSAYQYKDKEDSAYDKSSASLYAAISF